MREINACVGQNIPALSHPGGSEISEKDVAPLANPFIIIVLSFILSSISLVFIKFR
jgi:hypothetical protein